MRKSAAILIGLWVICMTCATSICAATAPNKLDTLKIFIQKKILYDEYVSVDSVICWSENILPDLKADNRNKETYFITATTCQRLYTAGRYQPCHRPGTADVRRSQRNRIRFRHGSCQPSYRRRLHHSQSIRQSIGGVSKRFKGIKPYLSATSLPYATFTKSIQYFTAQRPTGKSKERIKRYR